MPQGTDTSERSFQKLIVDSLVNEQGYEQSYSNEFDKEFCLNRSQLLSFIEATQPDTYAYLQSRGIRGFLVRLDKRIQEKGTIDALRKGIKFNDKSISLFYPEPNSGYNTKDHERYQANIFSVTEELIYTDDNRNRLDLALFVNGLPIITMELKNGFTHQAVKHAIRQYLTDRKTRHKIFHLGRCMVHFAADTTQVYMAGALSGKSTAFFPFNKGLNDGQAHQPFGAGNPVNPGGLQTDYLWKEVLTKRSLSNIIEKFAGLIEEKDPKTGRITRKQIFPRYHQLTAVRSLLADAKQKGVGKRYLIQHSAGSGKSNSITWLALQLVSLYDQTNTNPLFDSVVVVTDRTVLDKQLRDNIKAFAQVKKYIEAITGEARHIKQLDPNEEAISKTSHMRLALANNKKIITCTVQTFPHVLKTIQDMKAKKVAIVIDEAHSSQSGEAAASMNALFADLETTSELFDEEGNLDTEELLNHLMDRRKMLPNASYFAFTATPKNKTLETFGTEESYQDEHGENHSRFIPFHTYSMKQAIEEEFILDVLQNYTTWRSFYRVGQSDDASGQETFETTEANKRIRSFVEGHELAIAEKARIMIDHFMGQVHTRIAHKAKAMVVCKSIEAAIKYKEAFDAYLAEINAPYKSIVAFSGKKKHWKTGEELTEVKMNSFPDGENDIPEQFEKDEYRFLIVANKYQTGFDQPLLHTMYVDKQLSDVQAVQTLSRLNRAKKPLKRETFVLDFYNDVEDIEVAFKPYYTTTILGEETNPDKLNDLQEALEDTQVYDPELVLAFFQEYYNAKTGRESLDAMIAGVANSFSEELTREQQVKFKGNVKTFVRTYSYLSRILNFKKAHWEMSWLFLKHLIPHLHIEEDVLEENIIEVIDMESYRASRMHEGVSIVMEDVEGYVSPIPVEMGGVKPEAVFDTLESIVNAFNQRFGDIDWGEGIDAKDVEQVLTKDLPQKLESDRESLMAILNSDKANAREESNNLVKALMQSMMFTNTALYKKYADDDNFRTRYQEFIFDMIWSKLRSGKKV